MLINVIRMAHSHRASGKLFQEAEYAIMCRVRESFAPAGAIQQDGSKWIDEHKFPRRRRLRQNFPRMV